MQQNMLQNLLLETCFAKSWVDPLLGGSTKCEKKQRLFNNLVLEDRFCACYWLKNMQQNMFQPPPPLETCFAKSWVDPLWGGVENAKKTMFVLTIWFWRTLLVHVIG